MEKAIFAAGCFWGVQFYFDQVPGVVKSTAGYTGGHTETPTYEQVCDEAQAKFGKPIVTQITPASRFYEAEEYHQEYAERTGRGQCHIPYTPI